MTFADDAAAGSLRADELLALGMRALRSKDPPPGADALEVIERIEAELAHRQEERDAAASGQVEENPRG